ncbi:MAG: SDR family NAD(P)-dependent oxidoreductase [Chloroflexi bacterium]|nr:SDR family NAD(P)-dependent oxidoreductase [Chloroflexota bacterium]
MTALRDHTAVVTGASSGVGKAIALGLAGQRTTLCLVGRKLETLKPVAESALAKTSRVLSYEADLTVDKDLQDLAANLQREVGSIDILIHSAGVISHGRLETEPVENLDWQYRTNVRAIYALTQALLPMLRARQGQIVFINSSAGQTAKAGVGQYAATKHALKAIADSLREEVNVDGIRVLSVFLGRTASPMQATVHKMEGKAYDPERLLQPEDVASIVISALTLPRTAEVTDINIRPLMKPT